MIDIEYIDCPYVVSKFEEHDNVKNILLENIESMTHSSLSDNNGQAITNTDWHTGLDVERKYWNILAPHLTSHMINVYRKLGFTHFGFLNYWFQQYYKDSFHEWHVHGSASWTNVYYLELPNDEVKTNVRNQKTNSVVIPNVKEGYILTLPAILWHRSPINLGDKRKTVIVFNTTTPN